MPGADKKATSASGEAWPRDEAVHLVRISLDGIRRFHKVSLKLQPPTQPHVGQWLLFVGANGTGKTTLLRALALALLEHDVALALDIFLADAPMLNVRAQEGKSTVYLRTHSGQQKTSVHWEQKPGKQRTMTSNGAGRAIPVFAYGCRRGGALGGPQRRIDTAPTGDAATLFDPQSSLIHTESWLRQLAYGAAHDATERAILETVTDLLDDPHGSPDAVLPGVRRIEVSSDRTWAHGPGNERVPLAALGDGYLTTLGWIVDFLARWLAYARRHGYVIEYGFQRRMPAIVLIDGIDLHLHPRWQTRILSALAENFPQTTFIATTNNPLTVTSTLMTRQMNGSVHIIQDHGRGDGSLDITRCDPSAGQSVDEILTGEWFGLDTTV